MSGQERTPPPHSEQAETSLLGAIILGGTEPELDLYPLVAASVSADDFYVTRHVSIFGAMGRLHAAGTRVDHVTLLDELQRGELLDRVGGEAYLAQLAAYVPSSAGWIDYAKIVRRDSIRRKSINLATAIKSAANTNTAAEPIEALASELSELLRSTRPHSTEQVRFREPDELANDEDAEIEWYVEDFLAAGQVTLFAAKPKIGKSTLAFAMLAALERGHEFLDRATRQTLAVYLSEESARTIRQKTTRFGLSRVRLLTRSAAYPTRKFDEWVDLAIAEAERSGAGVIVIDTLTMWAGLAPDAEKDSGAMHRVASTLLRASGRGLAVLLIHHSRKAAGQGTDAVRGSNALPAAADVIITVEEVSGGDSSLRRLRFSGRDDSLPSSLIVSLQDDGFELVGDEEELEEEGLEERILGVLPGDRESWMRTEEIRKAVGAQNKRVKAALDSMVESGAIERNGTGHRGSPIRYRLAPTTLCSRSRPYSGGPGTETKDDRDIVLVEETDEDGNVREYVQYADHESPESDSVPGPTPKEGTGTETNVADDGSGAEATGQGEGA